jgi:hypothetical protein
MDNDFGAWIDDLGKVRTQHVPVQRTIFVIHEALIPNTHGFS